MKTEYFDYTDGNVTCEGYLAYGGEETSKLPCVLICHAWGGQLEVERERARQLAELGYIGFAIDMYGKGIRGGVTEDNSKLIQPFIKNRALLRKRITAALNAAKDHPMVDQDRIAAMGYCFGGLCVLDLARSVPDSLKGVVSFHGLFDPPNLGPQLPITAKILLLHGYEDPMATPIQMIAIAQELTKAQADWQIHAYGHTTHGFTFQAMNAPKKGLMYNTNADRRSWIAACNFFKEILEC